MACLTIVSITAAHVLALRGRGAAIDAYMSAAAMWEAFPASANDLVEIAAMKESCRAHSGGPAGGVINDAEPASPAPWASSTPRSPAPSPSTVASTDTGLGRGLGGVGDSPRSWGQAHLLGANNRPQAVGPTTARRGGAGGERGVQLRAPLLTNDDTHSEMRGVRRAVPATANGARGMVGAGGVYTTAVMPFAPVPTSLQHQQQHAQMMQMQAQQQYLNQGMVMVMVPAGDGSHTRMLMPAAALQSALESQLQQLGQGQGGMQQPHYFYPQAGAAAGAAAAAPTSFNPINTARSSSSLQGGGGGGSSYDPGSPSSSSASSGGGGGSPAGRPGGGGGFNIPLSSWLQGQAITAVNTAVQRVQVQGQQQQQQHMVRGQGMFAGLSVPSSSAPPASPTAPASTTTPVYGYYTQARGAVGGPASYGPQ